MTAASGKTEFGMGQLASIQVLRALAAIMVTVAHASEEAKYFYGFTPWIETDPFGKGVDLFFIISGFIIYYSSVKLFDLPRPHVQFIKNRLIRVVPIYYIFTTLMIMVIIFAPGGVKEAKFDVYQFISSYLFFPYERYDGRISPILSLGWTLNYEMFFYAMFSLCLMVSRAHVALCTIILLFVLSVLGALGVGAEFAAIRFWTNSIILEFAMGILIALAYARWGKAFALSTGLAVAVALVGLLALYYLNMPHKPFALPRFVSAGIPSAITVAALVLLLPAAVERRLPRFMVALGDSSYSLYLSHRFVQRPIQILLTKSGIFGPGTVGGVYVVMAVIAAIGVGHLVYLLIERPLLHWMRSMSRGRVGRPLGERS